MPRVTGWSEDEFDDRAQNLAALIRRVWRAIARLVAAQAEQQSQVTMAVAKPILPQWQQAVDGQIIGFVRNMYLDAAGTVSDALNAPDELLIGDDLVEVYTNAARNRLVGIGDDVWKNVQAQIALGNQSGESIADIAARIRNVTGVSEGRSLTIARTEVHAAHESGSYEQAVFVDPDAEKTWLATEDTRTRPSHRAADGQTVKIGEAFNIGGSKLRYPGDPLGTPEDCVNCRCSVAYNFDMITAVVDEPEPAMVAAGEQMWKAHQHPRGNDGKFIKSGIVADFLKKSKPNIIDVTKAVGNLDTAQWGKLTDAQKTHIKDSVDKLPKGTATHNQAKKTLDSLEKSAAATAPAASKPKTKIGETYAKLKDAKHGDVLATGTKYNSAGVAQKFKITADKSHVHPDYMPYGKMKLEFLKKNGEPGQATTGDILSISQKLHPLPAKGKKPSKVEWDEPGETVAPVAPVVATPPKLPKLKASNINAIWDAIQELDDGTVIGTKTKYGTNYRAIVSGSAPGSKKLLLQEYADGYWKVGASALWGKEVFKWELANENWSSPSVTPAQVTPNVDAPATTPGKIPTGLKGAPGDSAKITTGVVWGKHPAGTTIVESEDGNDKIVWNGKKYEFQTLDDIGDWATQFEMSKKDFYAQHKDDTGWKVPGGEKTPPPPLVPDADLLEQAYNDPNDNDGHDAPPEQINPDAAGYDPTPDEVDWNLGQWERENAKQATSEPPQTPPTPEPTATPAVTPGITDKQLGDLVTGMMNADTPGDWTALQQKFHNDLAENSDKPAWTVPQNFVYFTKVSGQAGSNPGGKYKAPDGTEWYIKKPKSTKHAANEMAAAAFYNLAGIDAPQVMKGKGAPELGAPGTMQTGTKIVPGAKANLGSKLHDKDYVKQIQSGFAMDAWLANWDVAGMGYDNVVEGADGKPHRIDVGGAMLYRAQGTEKGDAFGNVVDELKTLRDGTNPQAAAVFGSMTDEDIRKSAAKVEAISEAQIDQIVKDAGLDASVAETLKARRQDILAKYPPISKTDELLDEVLGPPATTSPWAGTDKDKLEQYYKKGLITQQEFIDAGGEEPDDPYGGIADKGVLLNDLESGAILPMPQAIDLGIMLNESDYNDLSNMEKDQLETTLSTAANMDMPGGKDAYAHWQSLHNTAPSDPMIDGSSLSLHSLYALIQTGKAQKKYTDGQVIATSPDGKHQIYWAEYEDSYVWQHLDGSGPPSFLSNIKTIQTIRTNAYHIPESHLPNHDGTLIESAPNLAVPTPGDPVVDTETIGTTNHGALYALDNGDADEFVTIDGKWSLKKASFSFGDSYVVGEKHDNGLTTTTLFDNPNELEGYSGLQVWYPKQEIDESTNAPDATAGVSNKPVDLSVIQEDIELGKYTSGEVIGVTKNGQQKLVYSAFIGGVQLKHKVGNTDDDDMDWDTEASYSDDTGSPVADFLDDYPGIELFEPQDPNAVAADDNSSNTNWDAMLSGPHVYNDVVAQTGDGKFQLVHKGMGSYQLYAKADGGSVYTANGGSYYHDDLIGGDLDNGVLSAGHRWQKVNPGTQFKSGNVPAKKMPAKKVAKAVKSAGVPKPGAYSPATVTPNEKKFYLEDAEVGSLVPVEAIHLLNGANGLDVHEAGNLTPTQTASINTQLQKALDSNLGGSAAAWQKWADLANQVNAQQLNGGNTGYDASKIADASYFLDVENDMWAGDKSTGDVFAITPDGKHQLMIHSTDGPFENPNSFAMQTHGPYGWETVQIYDNAGYGGPPGKLAADTWAMSKTWLKPDADSTDVTPTATPVSFDPPGTGAQAASVIFGMLDWVPEGKTLLVGKDDNGDAFKMTATKNMYGEKVIQISQWHGDVDGGKFQPVAHVSGEQEYNHWDADNIKWDAVSELPDKSALDDFMGNPNSPTTPAAPTAPRLPLTLSNIDAIWAKAQTLDVGTVIGTTVSGMGNNRRLIVGLTGSGVKTITVEQKDQLGNWKKWNDVSKTGLGYELDAYIWTSKIHDTPTPSLPSSSVGKQLSTKDEAQALWDAAQKLPIGTVIATGQNSSGTNMRMVIATHANGSHYVSVEKEQTDGTWEHAWLNTHVESVWDDLIDDDFFAAIDLDAPTAPSTPKSDTGFAPVLESGSKLEPGHSKSLWAAVQNLGEDTVVATGTNSSGAPIQMVVKKHIQGYSILSVQKKHPVSGNWSWWYGILDEDHLSQDLDDENWVTDIDLPDATPTPAVTPSVTAPSTPPAPAGPPTPKLLPINTAADVKFHLKNSGNLGYYSKPENIWVAIKEWQTKPGNEQYSPMDIFKSLDHTLKTSKPNPFQEKMTKWAATKKGAQIIGQDGIYGPKPSTPAAPSAPSASPPAGLDFTQSPDNAAKIWSSINSLPDGTVLAHVTTLAGVDKQMYVATEPSGAKIIAIKAFDPVSAGWTDYGSYKTVDKLVAGLGQNWKPGPNKSVGAPLGAPKKMPDIEAGNDISGISDDKQQEIYSKFKAEPFTYLSSPEHSIFDAAQAVATNEKLTLGQVLNIIDEVGAKKFGVTNTGPFKQKLATWVKTPEAAAHILNEPEVITGLAKPPAYHLQYDPDLNPGQIPSFEESSKFTYDYVPNISTATTIWSSITAKTADFSEAEKKALTVWTGGAYTTINGYLIKPNPSPLSSTHKSAMTGSQLGMRPSDRPMLLVRGTGFSGLGNAKNHAQLEKMVGTTWRNNGFAATSVGQEDGDPPGVYAPAFNSYPLWIEFEAPPGTPMAWVTPFSSVGTSEREMLLGANLHYKILSVEKKMIPGYGMKTIARVRIVPKPEGAAE